MPKLGQSNPIVFTVHAPRVRIVDSEYVVAWNQCTVVAIIIRIHIYTRVSFADLGDIREFLLLAV